MKEEVLNNSKEKTMVKGKIIVSEYTDKNGETKQDIEFKINEICFVQQAIKKKNKDAKKTYKISSI